MAQAPGTALALGLQRRRDFNRQRDQQERLQNDQNDRAASAERRTQETYDYGKSQRPAVEAARTAQTEASRAAAGLSQSRQQTELAKQQQLQREAQRKARDNGVMRLIDDIDAGIDPSTAMARYNSVGDHRITDLQVTRGAKPGDHALQFTDGEDGVIRATTGQLRAAMTASLDRAAGPKVVGRSLVTASGKKIFEDEPAINVSAGGIVVKGGKVIARNPKTDSGGSGKGGGQKRSPLNVQSFDRDIQQVVGNRFGGKYDDKYGMVLPAGNTKRAMEVSARASKFARRAGWENLSAQDAVGAVADLYDQVKSEEEYLAEAKKAVPIDTLRRTFNTMTDAQYEDNRRKAARDMRAQALRSADAQLDKSADEIAARAITTDDTTVDTTDDAASEDVAPDGADVEGDVAQDEGADGSGEPDYTAAGEGGAWRFRGADGKTIERRVTRGLIDRLRMLPPGTMLPDPGIPGLNWELRPDGKVAPAQ